MLEDLENSNCIIQNVLSDDHKSFKLTRLIDSIDYVPSILTAQETIQK